MPRSASRSPRSAISSVRCVTGLISIHLRDTNRAMRFTHLTGHDLNPVRPEPPNPGRPRHASSGWGEAPLDIEQHELRVQQVELVRGEYRRSVLGDFLPSDRTRRLGKEALVHRDAEGLLLPHDRQLDSFEVASKHVRRAAIQY